MIVGVTGLIGHGKTYRAVREAVKLARLRRCLLASNIRITVPGVETVQLPVGEDGLDVPFLMGLVDELRAQGRGLVVLVDEVGIIMPARWWSKFPIRFLFLLSQSRKFKVDMVWTAQHQDQVDKVLRDLTEYTDKVKALPAPSLRRRERGDRPFCFRWTRWIGVSVDKAGSVQSASKRIDAGWELYRRETEAWYSTDEIVAPPSRLMDEGDRALSNRSGRPPRGQRNGTGAVLPSHLANGEAQAQRSDPLRVDSGGSTGGLAWGAPTSAIADSGRPGGPQATQGAEDRQADRPPTDAGESATLGAAASPEGAGAVASLDQRT